jgi:hypothetical protein
MAEQFQKSELSVLVQHAFQGIPMQGLHTGSCDAVQACGIGIHARADIFLPCESFRISRHSFHRQKLEMHSGLSLF